MDDQAAYIQLVLANAQGELAPLEYGIHALKAVPPAQGKEGEGTDGLLKGTRQNAAVFITTP